MGLLYQMIVGNASGIEALERVRSISQAELIEKMDAFLVISEEEDDIGD